MANREDKMVRGLYTAASGMLAQWERTNVLSNNVANADTTGFKVDEALIRAYPTQAIVRKNDVTLPFDPVKFDLRPPIGVLGTGAQVEEVVPIFTQGPLEETKNPLDIALAGDGFLAVQTPAGIRYTRDGSLALNREGVLVNRSGHPVLSTMQQPILLQQGEVHFDRDGRVYLDGTLIGQLLIVRFPNPEGLEKRGENLFIQTATSGVPFADTQTEVQQGYLEKPNMNIVEGMVEMIKAFRTYEANARVVQATDRTVDRLVNDVGNVGTR